MVRYYLDKRENGDLRCFALHAQGVSLIALATWTKMPGPRNVYWSHGLVIPEEYRRQGLSTHMHEILWEHVPYGSVVMLSVAHGNQAQHKRMTKLGYEKILNASQPEYYVYAKYKHNFNLDEGT